jgi:acetylornithine aminotransferase
VTVFATLIEDKLADRAARMGKVLGQALEALRAKYPKAVKEVRGRGLLMGLDLATPVGDVVNACRERGLLVLTAGDNTLRLAPALIVDEKEIAEGCAIIDKALESIKQ